jgi:hypothetical protein
MATLWRLVGRNGALANPHDVRISLGLDELHHGAFAFGTERPDRQR